MTQFITTDALKIVAGRAGARNRRSSPPSVVDDDVFYQPVASSAEIAFDYERPKMSAKEFMWPATETIATMDPVAPSISAPVMERDRCSSACAPATPGASRPWTPSC